MKELVDLTACGTIVTSYLGFLPPIAAGFAIIWYAVQLYDRFKQRED
jgi:hypothetical protein